MGEKDDFGLDRRKFLAYFGSIGLGGTLLPGVLWAQAQQQAQATGAIQILPEMVGLAARVADVPLSPDAQKRIADDLNRRGGLLANYEQLRDMKLGNDTPSALCLQPASPRDEGPRRPANVFKYSQPKVAKPKTDEDLAFLPVTHLAQLVSEPDGHVGRPDQALPRAAEEIRSHPPLRRHPDRGAGPQAGRPGRRRDQGREIPRPAPRHPLGSQGPSGGQGIQNDVRRLALQRPDDRRRRDGLHPADAKPAPCSRPS